MYIEMNFDITKILIHENESQKNKKLKYSFVSNFYVVNDFGLRYHWRDIKKCASTKELYVNKSESDKK